GFGFGEVAVQGEVAQPGQQGGSGKGGGEPRAAEGQQVAGELADPGVFPGADAVLHPGVHPVGGVDAGGLAAPAGGSFGQVGDPQAVPPAVFGFEQGQLGAGVGALAAGEDPHGGGPGGEPGTGPSLPLQWGALGGVGFPVP